MAPIASTLTSIRRFRRFRGWAIGLAALASLLVAASAVAAAQDLRSPDARAGAALPAAQAPSSPGASDNALQLRRAQTAAPLDLRSPDARETGSFVSSPQDSGSSGVSGWIYLAAAGLVSLALIGASVLLVQHRRRDTMPIGT
jgi:hypothetical protein